MHICKSKLTIIDSDNVLLLGRCQTIIWTNAGILLIGPLRTNFSKILIGIYTFSFKNLHLKIHLENGSRHGSDLIIRMMASQIIAVLMVYSTVCSGTDQRKHQSSTSLAFVRGIHQWPVNFWHKGPVMWKMFALWFCLGLNILWSFTDTLSLF